MTGPSTVEPAGVPEQSGPSGLVAVAPPSPDHRLRLDVAYDGTDFHGWARQPGLRSVQAELEHALRAVLRIPEDHPVRVAVAGRTDAGVHAVGQVCHADVPAAAWASVGTRPRAVAEPGQPGRPRVDPDTPRIVRRRLNGLLPTDVRVRELRFAPEGFDARWSAAWRRYAYLVADDPSDQDPRLRGHVLWHPRPLDVDAMDAAAARFVGEHDFAAFCRARAGASTVRTIHDIGWRRIVRSDPLGGAPNGPAATPPCPPSVSGLGAADPGPGALEFTIRADAFCHSMVRALVGAFLAVGDHRWPVQRPAELLAAAQRVPVIPTAPAHGLTLVEVGYPPDAELAAQAQRARRWRGR